MGLDGVELIMELEDEFEISIPDEAAQELQTVGDVHTYVLRKLHRTRHPGAVCVSQRTFYRLRASAKEIGIVAADARVRTSTPILLSGGWLARRRSWRALGRRDKMEVPPLETPGWFMVVLLGTGVFVISHSLGMGWGILLFLPTLLLCAILASWLGWRPPESTWGNLAWVSRLRLADLRETVVDSLWYRVCKIVSAQLGVPIAMLRPETSFVEDLGMD